MFAVLIIFNNNSLWYIMQCFVVSTKIFCRVWNLRFWISNYFQFHIWRSWFELFRNKMFKVFTSAGSKIIVGRKHQEVKTLFLHDMCETIKNLRNPNNGSCRFLKFSSTENFCDRNSNSNQKAWRRWNERNKGGNFSVM